MNDPVLRVRGLSKRFGDLVAVDELSFEVASGEVFGLLGPNGAGKTTAIRMICGLLAADGGEVTVHGRPLGARTADRVRVGLCPQELVLWNRLTCLEQLTFVGTQYDLPSREARQRGERLLAELGLIDKSHVLASALSGGMQRRLNLALALVHDPELVILDEPGAGLDPQSRVLVRDFIRALARDKAVLLTTHDMEEADRLADRVAIVVRGRQLVCDRPEALKRELAERHGQIAEVRLGPDAEAERAAGALAGWPGLTVRPAPGLLTLLGPGLVAALPALLERLGTFDVGEVRVRAPSLEDVFLDRIGSAVSTGEGARP